MFDACHTDRLDHSSSPKRLPCRGRSVREPDFFATVHLFSFALLVFIDSPAHTLIFVTMPLDELNKLIQELDDNLAGISHPPPRVDRGHLDGSERQTPNSSFRFDNYGFGDHGTQSGGFSLIMTALVRY